MDISGFTKEQLEALVDLLIVGMYADHNLASAEDQRIQKVLDALEFQSDYERQAFCDAAFTHARDQAGSPESFPPYVSRVASHFTTQEARRRAYGILNDLITSDGRVSGDESRLLSAAREAFGF